MRVQDLMSRPIVTCHVNDPLNIVAQRMWDHDCGSLAVINDEGVLTGMITDRDVCMAAYTQGRALDQILVNTAMAKHIASATPEQTVAEIEQLMAKHRVHRIPIVDGTGRPIGMVSLNDLAMESVQPDSRLKQGPSKIAYTLAAICRRHIPSKRAA